MTCDMIYHNVGARVRVRSHASILVDHGFALTDQCA